MTCAGCTHARLRFFQHRPEYSPFCKVWDQVIDTDDPACPHFNPDAYIGPVVTNSGRSSIAGPLWPGRAASDPYGSPDRHDGSEKVEEKEPEMDHLIPAGSFSQFNVFI